MKIQGESFYLILMLKRWLYERLGKVNVSESWNWALLFVYRLVFRALRPSSFTFLFSCVYYFADTCCSLLSFLSYNAKRFNFRNPVSHTYASYPHTSFFPLKFSSGVWSFQIVICICSTNIQRRIHIGFILELYSEYTVFISITSVT